MDTEVENKIGEAMRKFLAGESTLGELRGFSPEELEAVYSTAYNLYQAGKYEDALALFKFLTMFDHLNEKYWMSLGAVRQVRKEWDLAIQAYSYVCVTLNIKNVKASARAGQCYLAKGDEKNALSAAEHVKHYADPKNPNDRESIVWANRVLKSVKTA